MKNHLSFDASRSIIIHCSAGRHNASKQPNIITFDKFAALFHLPAASVLSTAVRFSRRTLFSPPGPLFQSLAKLNILLSVLFSSAVCRNTLEIPYVLIPQLCSLALQHFLCPLPPSDASKLAQFRRRNECDYIFLYENPHLSAARSLFQRRIKSSLSIYDLFLIAFHHYEQSIAAFILGALAL